MSHLLLYTRIMFYCSVAKVFGACCETVCLCIDLQLVVPVVARRFSLHLFLCCSSCRVSRSWITVCWWASTTWTRPAEKRSVVEAVWSTIRGLKEQWPQISADHKPRKVCIAPPWSPSRGRLEGRELWIQKISECDHQHTCISLYLLAGEIVAVK